VTSGTARTLFSNYKIAIAAKTGTAETNGSDNVTFIAYAPYDNPQIAVAVVLPHGAAGTYAQNIAKDIFDAYFQS
jgi:penicillin-binding protein 2